MRGVQIKYATEKSYRGVRECWAKKKSAKYASQRTLTTRDGGGMF